MSCFRGFETICQADAALAERTWYKLGGSARGLLTPTDRVQLGALVQRCHEQGIGWRVLGRGANLLVGDEGFDGAVICLSHKSFATLTADGERLTVGGGADFPKLIRAAINRGLVGLEALAGIPGTLGGVVRMNAGGRHGEMRQFVESVELLTSAGEIELRSAAQLGFSYRHSDLDGCVVLATTMKLAKGDPAEAMQRHREIWNEKYASQPAVSERSAGCIFKNPAGQSAGKLLDESGLKGTRVGGAEISHKHANFIVADEGASASDVLKLIEIARARVRAHANIHLELEIEVWESSEAERNVTWKSQASKSDRMINAGRGT